MRIVLFRNESKTKYHDLRRNTGQEVWEKRIAQTRSLGTRV